MTLFKNNNESRDNGLKGQVLTGADIVLLAAIISLLLFPTWRRGGTIREYIAPYLGMAVAAFFIFLLSPYLRRTSHRHGMSLVEDRIKAILRDPIFYIGALFLVSLYIQWWNSGKVYILEDKALEVMFSPAAIDWLPGAVNTLKSWDMLVWFFPAFVLLLMVRHGCPGKWSLIIVSWIMAVNSSFLAIIGIIAPLMGKKYLSWLTSILVLPPHSSASFSTFGYANHAASFFLLHLGLTCGLFFYYCINRKQHRRIPVKTGLSLMIILVQFYTLHRCRSIYGMIFSWLIMAVFVFYGLYLFSRENRERKIKPGFIVTGVILLVVTGISGLYLTGKSDILSEFSTMREPGKYIKEQAAVKLFFISAAVDLWRHNPVFGIGGGSYGEYLIYYERPNSNKYIRTHAPGKANTHNDFFQFLCEFGILGLGLLMAALVLLTAKIAKNKAWQQGLVLFGLLGMSGILIQGSMDLPFRNPSVLMSFVFLLAVYGTLDHRQQPGEISSKKGSVTPLVTRLINFYTVLFLFIIVAAWWTLTPVRQKISGDMVRGVDKLYRAQLITPQYDRVTPGRSPNASASMIVSLLPAKLLYGDSKDLHLLSAKIYFDLYRNSKPDPGKDNAGKDNEKNAKKYLLEAFHSALAAKRYTTYADIDFIAVYTAVLDELGYYLEEGRTLKALLDSSPDDIRVNLLVREYYIRRPHLVW
jgi:hypothetical protein